MNEIYFFTGLFPEGKFVNFCIIENFDSIYKMLEDEQILLQNLSTYYLEQTSPTLSSPPKLMLDDYECSMAEKSKFITESKRKDQYYIDWSKSNNHEYFTRLVIIEADEDSSPKKAKIVIETPRTRNFSQINQQLELALTRIKSAQKTKEEKYYTKRSQSIEHTHSRENVEMSRTGRQFFGKYRQRKPSMRGRAHTESDQPSCVLKKSEQYDKMQKYKTNPVITEENEQYGGNLKQNTLKNKFLTSIAQWQQKKEKRIQERIQKQLKQSMEGVTFTPQINPKSRQIMKKKGNMLPIYQREFKERKRQLTQRFNVDLKGKHKF